MAAKVIEYLHRMIFEIDGKLVSGELFDRKFACDLNSCKGACCIEGDAGAPLEASEVEILEREIDNIIPFMRLEGIESIKEKGVFTMDDDGEFVTPLVNGRECAFVFFDKNEIAMCAIEQANIERKTEFKKPISCHLYPIRVSNLSMGEALNYHKWQICRSACDCGSKLEIPVYRFLKEPIVRKFGEDFFEQLCIAQRARNTEDSN